MAKKPETIVDKEKSKSVQYFRENCVEDMEDLITIGLVAQKELFENFKVNLPYPETVLAVYACIFDAIRKVLKQYEETEDSYSINIANRLEVGFTSSADTETSRQMEKVGNFMIYLKHIQNNSLTEINRDEPKSVVICTQWNAMNIKSSISAVKRICVEALKILEERLAMPVASPEVIIPVFCTIHQTIVKCAMLKREELKEFEYQLNVLGCYTLFIRQLEDGVDVGLKTAIYDKGSMKHDAKSNDKFNE